MWIITTKRCVFLVISVNQAHTFNVRLQVMYLDLVDKHFVYFKVNDSTSSMSINKTTQCVFVHFQTASVLFNEMSDR